ncbi:MAG: FAD:protein FMN transferase [Chloroflexi bacterium]|nr:FAD:protein FMN transferase [Chloroflexota bacterium]
MQFADHFRAMDTGVDVLVEADSLPMAAFLSVKLLFEQQEQRFSRFRPDSLLSRLNRGDEVTDPLFAECCRMAIEAWEFTGGLFNPLVLPALRQAGYDRTFAEVDTGDPQPMAVPSPAEALRLTAGGARLAGGMLDLGGIVKGWTADLAVETLVGDHPDILVNAGGDLRCAGSDEDGGGWLVGVSGETDDDDAWAGRIVGALATSTTRKRRWEAGSGFAHHLIDPRTGLPAASPYDQVSCLDKEAWRAECWAKAVLIGGREATERASASTLGLLAMGPGGVRDARGAMSPD